MEHNSNYGDYSSNNLGYPIYPSNIPNQYPNSSGINNPNSTQNQYHQPPIFPNSNQFPPNSDFVPKFINPNAPQMNVQSDLEEKTIALLQKAQEIVNQILGKKPVSPSESEKNSSSTSSSSMMSNAGKTFVSGMNNLPPVNVDLSSRTYNVLSTATNNTTHVHPSSPKKENEINKKEEKEEAKKKENEMSTAEKIGLGAIAVLSLGWLAKNGGTYLAEYATIETQCSEFNDLDKEWRFIKKQNNEPYNQYYASVEKISNSTKELIGGKRSNKRWDIVLILTGGVSAGIGLLGAINGSRKMIKVALFIGIMDGVAAIFKWSYNASNEFYTQKAQSIQKDLNEFNRY